jgi:uncharacterized delta-60 repeat protein
VQSDGRILAAHYAAWGEFYVSTNYLLRLQPGGAIDPTFRVFGGTNYGQRATVILPQPDGKILLGGIGLPLTPTDQSGVVRLHRDGAIDRSFVPEFPLRAFGTPDVTALAVQPDQKIIVCTGYSKDYSGFDEGLVVRLHPNGSLDTNFAPLPLWSGWDTVPAGGVAVAVMIRPDGKIILGGDFVWLPQPHALVEATGLALLNTNGAVDTNFNPVLQPGGPVEFGTLLPHFVQAAVLQPDGKMVIAGAFTNINGTNISDLARLNSDGSLDLVFQTRPSAGHPTTMLMQPDGKILVSGPQYPLRRLLSDQAVTIVAMSVLDDGSAVLSLAGERGQSYRIEGSTNLRDWTVLATGSITSCPSTFHDTNARAFPHRFYRPIQTP